MGRFTERTTMHGLRVVSEIGNLVELRCMTCNLRYFAPTGQENSMMCEAPQCLQKRQG